MVCPKCKAELFKIEIRDDCSKCEHNGAMTWADGYTYDSGEIETKDLDRTQARDEGECNMGSCFDNGCYIFICAKCGHTTNLAVLED